MTYNYYQGVVKERMSKVTMFAIALLFAATAAIGVYTTASAAKPTNNIQSGNITNSSDDVITTGYDNWGYNYQAHMFNGKYCDAYQNASWCHPYADVDLSMKWNDAWLSNKDRNDNGKLDRPTSYIDSGAWTTNHMSGMNDDGSHWTYFVKIVAVSSDDTKLGGVWYDSDGKEIGPEIWNDFAIVQEITNDPSAGLHGKQILSQAGPGLGNL